MIQNDVLPDSPICNVGARVLQLGTRLAVAMIMSNKDDSDNSETRKSKDKADEDKKTRPTAGRSKKGRELRKDIPGDGT